MSLARTVAELRAQEGCYVAAESLVALAALEHRGLMGGFVIVYPAKASLPRTPTAEVGADLASAVAPDACVPLK